MSTLEKELSERIKTKKGLNVGSRKERIEWRKERVERKRN